MIVPMSSACGQGLARGISFGRVSKGGTSAVPCERCGSEKTHILLLVVQPADLFEQSLRSIRVVYERVTL